MTLKEVLEYHFWSPPNKNIEKTGKIVLEPLKYIDFAYVYVDFTVEKFYWKEISRK